MQKIRALWELMRLEHGVMIALAIFIGSVITGQGLPSFEKGLFAFLTALFLEAATFSLNDYFDLEVDMKNKRLDRPLARGDLHPRTALFIYLFLLPSGLIASYLVNTTCFVVAAINAVIATLYDVKLKAVKIISNFYIAFVMAIPFIFGALAVSPHISHIIIVIAVIAFFSGAAREIMKDVMDLEGDMERHTRSFAFYFGKQMANHIASVLYVVTVIMSLIPYLVPIEQAYFHNHLYLAVVLITDFILLYISVILYSRHDLETMEKMRQLSLIALFIGLIAFLTGAFA
jgi:geranylgeranylglycerol-phosphate geranylgeranyltransferase